MSREQQPGPLVGREPAGEPDREDRRVEHVLEVLERGRRFAEARELVPQPALREERQLQLLALVGVPEVGRG